jgi:hypothetical protein
MPSFLATVAGFMDWEFAEVIVQGYLAGQPQGTNTAPIDHQTTTKTASDQNQNGTKTKPDQHQTST